MFFRETEYESSRIVTE